MNRGGAKLYAGEGRGGDVRQDKEIYHLWSFAQQTRLPRNARLLPFFVGVTNSKRRKWRKFCGGK
jgi:hypothetical protein